MFFKVNFHTFELKDLVRFNRNIEKLRSSSEPIVDDYEEDVATSSKKALAVQAIERLEKSKNITVNDISKVGKPKPVSNAPTHLRLSTVPMNLERQKDASKDIAIINIDSLDVGNMENLKKSPVYRNRLVDVYCVPNKK